MNCVDVEKENYVLGFFIMLRCLISFYVTKIVLKSETKKNFDR